MGKGQVIADPATGQMDITSQSGISLNANQILPGEIFLLKVPIYNLNQLVALPSGTCKFVITLGNKMSLDTSFTVGIAQLSNYFLWTTAIVGDKVQLTGNLTNTLPADFDAVLEFKIKAAASTGTSLIESEFLVTNHSASTLLSDEDVNNNTASLTYSVTTHTLPVNFNSLSLSKNECRVQVNFNAENAINVNRYEIELSKDGVQFIKIGVSQPSARTTYSFNFNLVDSLTAKSIFIRIKSVDNDGKIGYSTTKQMNGYCDENFGGMQLYPNPVQSNWAEVIITTTGKKFNGQYDLLLLDISGKLLKNTKLDLLNATRLNYPITHLSTGQYILRISNSVSGQLTNLRFNKL